VFNANLSFAGDTSIFSASIFSKSILKKTVFHTIDSTRIDLSPSTRFISVLCISFYSRQWSTCRKARVLARLRQVEEVGRDSNCSANNSDLRLLTRGTWANVIASPYHDSASARWPGYKAKRKVNLKFLGRRTRARGSIGEPRRW